MSKVVRNTLANSPMTPARKRRLAEIAARPESEVDFSDIPPLPESFWKNAVRNPVYKAVQPDRSGFGSPRRKEPKRA